MNIIFHALGPAEAARDGLRGQPGPAGVVCRGKGAARGRGRGQESGEEGRQAAAPRPPDGGGERLRPVRHEFRTGLRWHRLPLQRRRRGVRVPPLPVVRHVAGDDGEPQRGHLFLLGGQGKPTGLEDATTI